MRSTLFIFICLFSTSFASYTPHFRVIPLGTSGGPFESNSSSYLLSSIDDDTFVALDAGSLMGGIRVAERKGAFSERIARNRLDTTIPFRVLQDHIAAYLISHAHLDHVAGLVINSQVDKAKPIYASESTLEILCDHIFNWKIWPNFGNEGATPRLGIYSYKHLEYEREIEIEGTEMKMTPYLLSHGHGYESSAFLIEHRGEFTLYLGDTFPDTLSKSGRLERLWSAVAPLIREKRLKGIFLECSHPARVPDNKLCGHMNTTHFLREMESLAKKVELGDPRKALRGLKVIVTHMKASGRPGREAERAIEAELKSGNQLGIDLIIPRQGEAFLL